MQHTPRLIGFTHGLPQSTGFFAVATQPFGINDIVEKVVEMIGVAFQVETHESVAIDLFAREQGNIVVIGNAQLFHPTEIHI